MLASNQNILDNSIQFLKSVGPKRAASFEKIGLRSIKDLLFYFPTRYLDRRTLLTSNQAFKFVQDGFDGEITVVGKVYDKEKRTFKGKSILVVNFKDSDGFFESIWFQGAKYFEDKFNNGDIYAISAKPTISRHGKLQLAHPDFDKITQEESQFFFNTGKIIPFYRIPKELKETQLGDFSLRKIISSTIENYLSEIKESLNDELIKKNNLLDLKTTVLNLHFPESDELLAEARRRMKYEELFYLELLVASRKNNFKEKNIGIKFTVDTELINNFIKSLPYELTKAQLKVLSEIKKDMISDKTMNRLIQGDVGSGKTIVALISMLIAVGSGYQVSLMAPTEILAAQHAKNISALLKNFHTKFSEKEIKVTLLLGGQKKSVRNKKLDEIELQESDIIIGTHALLETDVQFRKLGMVVIDEQHRFGVLQRAQLLRKGIHPDTIIMSATPIPRTLTMTLYGDLDVSVIDEMPKNRIPIKTLLRSEIKLPDIYKFICDKAKENYQSFIVYPLVEESEKIELKAATEYYEKLKGTYFKDLRVALIHGRMKWQEKEEIMFLFAANQFDVLISTTVIEVGIDIPNANIILINDAHRFGLSQLHQLRGRVGRGNKQAYCVLVTGDELVAYSSHVSNRLEYLSTAQLEKYKSSVRLQSMVKYLDGFKIAEMDMKLRGPGDIFGIKQSGFPELKYSDLTTDAEILLTAKTDAFEIIRIDPKLIQPIHSPIRKNLINHYSENLKYAQIA